MKNEFACPVHEKVSGIDGNGQEYITICVNCRLDGRGICNGDIVVCENNYKHKKNSYSVCLMTGTMYVKNVAKGNDETLGIEEVKKIAERYRT